jgi:hypothetical protein
MFLTVFALTAGTAMSSSAAEIVEVYKSPTCGCCGKWINHLKDAGFVVREHNVMDVPAIRKQLGMPERFGACHSAKVAGYVVEGHVPVADIQRLIKARPKALGLAVPSMPPGSPGMETQKPIPYDTLLIRLDGGNSIFAKH